MRFDFLGSHYRMSSMFLVVCLLWVVITWFVGLYELQKVFGLQTVGNIFLPGCFFAQCDRILFKAWTYWKEPGRYYMKFWTCLNGSLVREHMCAATCAFCLACLPALRSGKYLWVESQSNPKVHLLCFFSLRDHSPVRPIVQCLITGDSHIFVRLFNYLL
jgi:hypothetical protein